jgi:hypothetical protein
VLLFLWAAPPGVVLATGHAHGQGPPGAGHDHAGTTPASGVARSPASAADIEVRRLEESGETILLATVTLDAAAVAGARVGFYVRRLFGDMELGVDITLDDGTAAVTFPHDLPGDATGMLTVVARVLEPDELAGAAAEARVEGGVPTSALAQATPRALWSSRPPIVLVVVIVSLLTIVWATYSVALYQLVQIRRLGKEPSTDEIV